MKGKERESFQSPPLSCSDDFANNSLCKHDPSFSLLSSYSSVLLEVNSVRGLNLILAKVKKAGHTLGNGILSIFAHMKMTFFYNMHHSFQRLEKTHLHAKERYNMLKFPAPIDDLFFHSIFVRP